MSGVVAAGGGLVAVNQSARCGWLVPGARMTTLPLRPGGPGDRYAPYEPDGELLADATVVGLTIEPGARGSCATTSVRGCDDRALARAA